MTWMKKLSEKFVTCLVKINLFAMLLEFVPLTILAVDISDISGIAIFQPNVICSKLFS